MTKVEFEVEGSTVDELLINAEAVADQVANGHKWNIVYAGLAQEADSYTEGGLAEIPKRVITRWRQEFRIKVDF